METLHSIMFFIKVCCIEISDNINKDDPFFIAFFLIVVISIIVFGLARDIRNKANNTKLAEEAVIEELGSTVKNAGNPIEYQVDHLPLRNKYLARANGQYLMTSSGDSSWVGESYSLIHASLFDNEVEAIVLIRLHQEQASGTGVTSKRIY